MTLTITHIYKDEGTCFKAQVFKYENVKRIETEIWEDYGKQLIIYFDDDTKGPKYMDIEDHRDVYDLIECY